MKKILSIITVVFLLVSTQIVNVSAINSESKAGDVSIASGSLNVRTSPSTTSTIKSSLKKGNYVTLISKSGSWWYVEYSKDSYGYCHENYIKTIDSKLGYVNISSGSLNVRSGPSSSYAKIDNLYKNNSVIILETSGNWHKILFNGNKIGYVSKTYINAQPTQQNNYPAIKLNVPNYKQTDTKWSGTYIGNSGKTIAQIGCVTTGIAMVESFRTKTTIYPNTMSERLKYTSSGNVYWPSYYTAVTSNSDYLQNIYNQLKNGKCVLFGAKNSYGAQHWVVITGYNGSSSLSASNFTINDPGSNTRTNLQSFLNSYPRFYKYFTY